MVSAARRRSHGSRHRSWATRLAVTATFLLTAALIAGPAQARSQRHTERAERQLKLARHQREDARLSAALARATHARAIHARAAHKVRAHAASATPFQRGDVFLTGSGAVQEYSPSGQLVQTLAGTTGAGPICFDPSGAHLIAPGVGLFNSSGKLQKSKWSSIAITPERCVADALGHVYVSTGSLNSIPYSITKYDINGNVLQTFGITDREFHSLAIDLGADECSIYYGSWGAPNSMIRRLNACTSTAETPFNGDSFVDDVRVLPDGRVIALDDSYAQLYDTSGQTILQKYTPPTDSDALRTLSLDPDGSSVWLCCGADRSGATHVSRFDIATGQLLADWSPSGTAAGSVTVYAPPLVGDADVAATVDSDTAGTAEAFSTKAGSSGQLTRLHLYVDPSSTATQAVVGIYSNKSGHPKALLEQVTISNLTPGSWNYADVPAAALTAGQRYWIAVLGPSGGGKLGFRDAASGGSSETSSKHNLTALPATWSTGGTSGSTSLSTYGS